MDKERRTRIDAHINRAIPADPTTPTTIAHIPDHDLKDTQNAVSEVRMTVIVELHGLHNASKLLREMSTPQLSGSRWGSYNVLPKSLREYVWLVSNI